MAPGAPPHQSGAVDSGSESHSQPEGSCAQRLPKVCRGLEPGKRSTDQTRKAWTATAPGKGGQSLRLPPWRTGSGRCSGLQLLPVPQASAGRAKSRCLSQGLEGHRELAARNWGEAGTRLVCLAESPENSPIVGSIHQMGMVEGSSGQPLDWVGSQGGQEERKARGCCRAPKDCCWEPLQGASRRSGVQQGKEGDETRAGKRTQE